MARVYDKAAIADFAKLLSQAAKAVRAGGIRDPGDVGQLIQAIRAVAIYHEGADAENIELWIDEQEADRTASYCQGVSCFANPNDDLSDMIILNEAGDYEIASLGMTANDARAFATEERKRNPNYLYMVWPHGVEVSQDAIDNLLAVKRARA